VPSFRECIIAAGKKGLIQDKNREKEMLAMFDDKLELFSKSMSKLEAEQAASNAVFKTVKQQVKKKAVENTIAVFKQNELKKVIDNYKNNLGEEDIAMGFRSLHGKAEGPRIVTNLEVRHKSIYGTLTSELSDVMEAYANRLMRKWKRANPQSLVDEMYELGSSGNKGAEIWAKSLQESLKKAKAMLAKNGVMIADDPDWKFPQAHNTTTIKKHLKKINKKFKKTMNETDADIASKKEWVNFIKPLLNKSKMVDDKTGLTFDVLPDAEFDKALDAALMNIITDGLGVGKKTGLKKFSESRFLKFKDSKGWGEYNTKFGSDPVQMMYEHLDVMARAIAETQIFGPKPQTVRAALKKHVQEKTYRRAFVKRKMLAQDETNRANSLIKKADIEYDLFVGRGHLSLDNRIAKVGSGFRNFGTGTLLSGSGPVVLIGDMATTFNNAAMRGWSPWRAVVNSLGEQFKGKEGRQFAAYLELILDDLIQNNMAMSRFMDDVDSGGLAKVYSTALLRLGGVSRFTQQARNAGGKFILSGQGLGKYTKYSFDDLVRLSKGKFNKYGKTLKLFDQYNITKADWEIIRTTEMWNPKGNLKFIDPGAIASRTDIDNNIATNVALKLKDLVMTEQDHMVVVNSVRQQAATSWLKRGSYGGELVLSAFMFKSFPINIIIHNIRRAFSAPPGAYNKAKYAAMLTLGMSFTGGVMMLANDILNGRDPRRVLSGDFWTQAILKGGALGPYGDALVGDPDARQFGFLLTGPIASFFGDFWGISGGAIYTALKGEENLNYGGRVSKLFRAWSPKPFYAKLIFQRYLFDTVDKHLNENHYDNMNRHMSGVYDKGSDYWWKPDELLPERLPKFKQ